ncbi:unnamed protein product [Mytilus coruscus]|uniref:Uncharacterized protein n=1 Tax=Mytilus coruscus TaxID=42192 RepID=A0A6J8BU69_MYTCO|nr:unnamed protein product [Mytilus coruscus]
MVEGKSKKRPVLPLSYEVERIVAKKECQKECDYWNTMSDHLSPLNELKFRDVIHVVKTSPIILNRQSISETEVAFSLGLSNNFLYQLNDAVAKYSLSFVSILNSQCNHFQLIDCERLNSRLKNLCYKILLEIKPIRGGQRKNYFLKHKSVTIFKHELLNVKKIQYTLSELDKEKVKLEKRCRDLFEQLAKENEHAVIISEQNLDIFTLQQQNSYLADRISKLEEQLPKYKDDKDFDQLAPKTQSRTLKKLETDAQRALWFSNTFGLTPKCLTMTSTKGKDISLNFQEKKCSDFNCMTLEDQDKIMKLVFLMDRLCVSDAAYHELTMVHNDMPRSYLLVQCRNGVNKSFEIERLPGNVPGAVINISSEIEKLLERHVNKHDDVNQVYVKFSGDGAKVSRISNFVFFSLSNASTANTTSFQEQQTFAIVECSENHESLKKCCLPVFNQINNILSREKWHIAGTDINVKYFVSSDMKFIQLLLGLGSCTGEYACPWCKVSKNERSNLSFHWNFYHEPSIARTVEEIAQEAKQNKKRFGCKHAPFLNLSVDQYIPDELHLMLRVTDILLRNLINDAKDLDSDLKLKRLPQTNLKKLTELIQGCEVAFSFLTNKAGELDWTSLSGSEKVKLLNQLPDQLLLQDGVIRDETRNDVVSLWKDLLFLYKYINESTDCGSIVLEKNKVWVENFLKIGSKFRNGYNLHNVTPYMHCFVYHLPYFVENFGPLKKFSGQGVEKNNDIVKQIHQKKSNKWDSAVSALTTRKRLEFGYMNNMEREKRSYFKKSEWWDGSLKIFRSGKRKEILKEISEANINSRTSLDFGEMNEHDLRAFLKDHGINTKIRNREKLMNLVSSNCLYI